MRYFASLDGIRISRRIFKSLLVLALGAGAAGCSCKQYRITIVSGPELKGMNAIPVEIYFPPPGDEVTRCQSIADSPDKDWFDPAQQNLIKNEYIVRFPVVATDQPAEIPYVVRGEIGKIFVFGDFGPGVDKKNRGAVKDPNTLQTKCTLKIQVNQNGLTAN